MSGSTTRRPPDEFYKTDDPEKLAELAFAGQPVSKWYAWLRRLMERRDK